MTEVYLGNPPQHVIDWIINHQQPSELGIPLYFEGQEDGATVALIAWNENMYQPEEHLHCNLECSTDSMSTWSAYDGEIIELDNCTGKRVYFRAPEGQPNMNGFYDMNNSIFHCFKLEKAVKAGGNIQFLLESTGTRIDVPAYAFYKMFGMSSWDDEKGKQINWSETLTQAPALPATTLADWCYNGMFSGCTSLVKAPALPATTLASNCYNSMFSNCTSLAQAPELPATTLADNCYSSMFSGCTSLVQAPALPATTLADWCYNGMFSSCTSLVQAPALPATALAGSCYSSMFSGCTSLVKAPALPATALADYCCLNMFRSCTSLIQAPALPATMLVSNCYNSMFNGCTSLASMDVSFTAWNPENATTSWMTNAGYNATGTKTFTCPAALPNTTGNSNIPSGWTRIEK